MHVSSSEGRNYFSKTWSDGRSTGLAVIILQSCVSLVNYLISRSQLYPLPPQRLHHHHHFRHSDQCFSNFNVYLDYSRSEVSLRLCISNRLPGDVDDACLLVTLWEARSLWILNEIIYVKVSVLWTKSPSITAKPEITLVSFFFKFLLQIHHQIPLMGRYPESSHLGPPPSLPTLAKPLSCLLSRDDRGSFLIGLPASIPVPSPTPLLNSSGPFSSQQPSGSFIV